MKLNSLIDFLPYEYKDQDTYKVNGKGILERYLQIFGDYFQDIITEDTKSVLDIIDIDNTPGYYLNYLWEFLGELPYANTPIISESTWKIYFAGFKDKDTMDRLCDEWLNYRTGVLEFDTDTVRKLLKCSVALFKIRGTKQFFEVLFRLYGLGLNIVDPVGDSTDLWIPDSHPLYDANDSQYDKEQIYDNTYKCTQCVPVEITISNHGFTSTTDEFFSFKQSIDALFERFLPYNVRANITYSGITLDKNYQITAEPQNGTIITPGQVDEINILVTVTADSRYKDVDLRYQVSGDGMNWSTTVYDSPSIYVGKRVGTVWFRCVGDTSVVTSVTLTRGEYILAYNIWGVIDGSSYSDPTTVKLPTWEENQSKLDVTVNGTLVATIGDQRINRNDLNIRLAETGEILTSPAKIEITKPGTYTFQLVDFPTRSWVLTVTAEDEFTIVANPNKATWNEMIPPSTVVTATSLYLDPATLTISQYNVNGDPIPLGPSPYTFTAPRAGSYYFLCDQDPNAKLASYIVMGPNVRMLYPLAVDFVNLDLTTTFDEGVPISLQRDLCIAWNLTPTGYALNPENYDLQIIGATIEILHNGEVKETVEVGAIQPDLADQLLMISLSNYTFTETGTYQARFTLNGVTVYSRTYKIIQKYEQEPLKLYIVPYDKTDTGWQNYDPEQDYTSLPYKFDENHPICRFYLKRSDNLDGNATRIDNNQVITLGTDGDPTEYSRDELPTGTYTFKLNQVSEEITAQLIIQKEPPVYTIQCDPTEVTLTANETSVSTVVTVTMTPEDTSGEYTYNINVPGLDQPVDAKNGYVFTTQAAGHFTFTVTDTADTDNPVQCTFIVESIGDIQPESLTWNAMETHEQTIYIDVPAAQTWTAEYQDS